MTREPQPGFTARWNDECPRCDQPIVGGKSRIVYVKGRPVHVACFAGQDDAA